MSDARNHPARDTAGGGIRDLATRRVLRREGAYCADRHAPEDWPLVIANGAAGSWSQPNPGQASGAAPGPRATAWGGPTVTKVARLLATPSAERAGTPRRHGISHPARQFRCEINVKSPRSAGALRLDRQVFATMSFVAMRGGVRR
jgi:hypothetical protein